MDNICASDSSHDVTYDPVLRQEAVSTRILQYDTYENMDNWSMEEIPVGGSASPKEVDAVSSSDHDNQSVTSDVMVDALTDRILDRIVEILHAKNNQGCLAIEETSITCEHISTQTDSTATECVHRGTQCDQISSTDMVNRESQWECMAGTYKDSSVQCGQHSVETSTQMDTIDCKDQSTETELLLRAVPDIHSSIFESRNENSPEFETVPRSLSPNQVIRAAGPLTAARHSQLNDKADTVPARTNDTTDGHNIDGNDETIDEYSGYDEDDNDADYSSSDDDMGDCTSQDSNAIGAPPVTNGHGWNGTNHQDRNAEKHNSERKHLELQSATKGQGITENNNEKHTDDSDSKSNDTTACHRHIQRARRTRRQKTSDPLPRTQLPCEVSIGAGWPPAYDSRLCQPAHHQTQMHYKPGPFNYGGGYDYGTPMYTDFKPPWFNFKMHPTWNQPYTHLESNGPHTYNPALHEASGSDSPNAEWYELNGPDCWNDYWRDHLSDAALVYADSDFLHDTFSWQNDHSQEMEAIPWLSKWKVYTCTHSVNLNIRYGQQEESLLLYPDDTLYDATYHIYDIITDDFKLQAVDLQFLSQVGSQHWRIPPSIKMGCLQSMFDPTHTMEITVILQQPIINRVRINHWTISWDQIWCLIFMGTNEAVMPSFQSKKLAACHIRPGSYITTSIWHCHKLISQWQCSFHLKAALLLGKRLATVSEFKVQCTPDISRLCISRNCIYRGRMLDPIFWRPRTRYFSRNRGNSLDPIRGRQFFVKFAHRDRLCSWSAGDNFSWNQL